MTTVLMDQNFGTSTTQVEAALKKHEAIAADIDSRVCISLFVGTCSYGTGIIMQFYVTCMCVAMVQLR